MAITSSDVLLIAPELSGLVDAQWDLILANVYAQLDTDVWGDNLDLGALYLAAHMGAMTRRGGSAGAVTAERAGEVSRAYAAPAVMAGALAATAYGQEFKSLIENLPGARFALSE